MTTSPPFEDSFERADAASLGAPWVAVGDPLAVVVGMAAAPVGGGASKIVFDTPDVTVRLVYYLAALQAKVTKTGVDVLATDTQLRVTKTGVDVLATDTQHRVTKTGVDVLLKP